MCRYDDVIMLNVIMLNVVMLCVVMLNVIILNVIVLNVVAPSEFTWDHQGVKVVKLFLSVSDQELK